MLLRPLIAENPDSARARAFLVERGVDTASVASYQLGYAPPGWTALTERLRAAGYTDPQLLDSGLALTTSRGTLVDRFRDRVMFPVHTAAAGARGQVIAFLGRSLDPAAGTDGGPPKYLNSPTTALYSKGEHLYGLGQYDGAAHLQGGAVPVLVEGPLDAIAVTSTGRKAYVGVAPCGTALTPVQADQLATRVPLAARGVIEAFDADEAGRQAATHAYPLLRAAGAWPTSAPIPGGHDPASLATADHDALTEVLHEAARHPLADQIVDRRMSRWQDRLDTAEGRVDAARDIAPLLAALPSDQVARQVGRVSRSFSVHPDVLTSELSEAVTRGDDWGRLERRAGAPHQAVNSAARAASDYPQPLLSARVPGVPPEPATIARDAIQRSAARAV